MGTGLVRISMVVAVLVLGASACGGSDESSEASAVTAQVEEICTEWGLSFADRGEFPVEGFDPESPDAADLPAVGAYFAAGLEAQPQAIASLQGLSATGEQREQLDALIAAWQAAYAGARAQVEAALASDVEAFVATLEGAAASSDAVDDAADALGVPDCGRA